MLLELKTAIGLLGILCIFGDKSYSATANGTISTNNNPYVCVHMYVNLYTDITMCIYTHTIYVCMYIYISYFFLQQSWEAGSANYYSHFIDEKNEIY